MKITSKTPVSDIAAALSEDGYSDSLASAVKQAALAGCLLWTKERLTTTNASRINARPGSSSYACCGAEGPLYSERRCALASGHEGRHEHGLMSWGAS